MQPVSPLWMPHIHADRRPALLARARITKILRSHFDSQGFLEIDPAILQVSPGNEAHIGGFATIMETPSGTHETLYLHSSPEFACKKLLAAGEEKIFTLGHVFRNRERGPLHHPEFTMLEWYRAHAPYEALMEDCAQILHYAALGAGIKQLTWRGHTADPFLPPEHLSVVEAFDRHAGVDLIPCLDAGGHERLAGHATRLGLRVSADDTWSDLFSKILSAEIEPKLGLGRATLLLDYPTSEAALARKKPDDPRFCERFELYACGVELANGFGELTDAHEQRSRFEAEMMEAERIYGASLPLDEDFLDALSHMPTASGCALGFDRLVMLATGAPSIEDVLWTPIARQGAVSRRQSA